MTIFRHAPLSLLMMVSLANIAFANNNDELPHTTLDPLVVTATKTPTKTSNVIAQTTVIDQKELTRHKGKTLMEVLANQAGITITQSGSMGTASNLYLRGYDSKNILVLIDGVRYGSITLGTPALSLLSADQIDHIEILHGASGTSLYGADAVGGVIAIFSKGYVGGKEGFGGSVTVGGGSHSQQLASVNGVWRNQSSSLSTSFTHNKTDGFDNIAQEKDWLGNVVAHNTDLDGYKASSGSVVYAHRFDDKVSVGLSGLYNHSTTDIDSGSFANAYAKQKNGAVNGFVSYQGKQSSTRLNLGQSQDKSITYDQWTPTGGRFDTTQTQARLETTAQATKNTNVLMGIEQLTQKVDSTQEYEIAKRKITSGFLGYQISDVYYDAQGNLRVDHNSQFGQKTNYNVGFAIKPFMGLRVGVNYATGFRMPTFNELYWVGSGNPNLRPEYSKNKEIFIEYHNALQRTRITGYRNDVQNKIAGFPATNIAKAQMEGVSLTSDWRFANGIVFGVGAEHLDSKNLSQRMLDDSYARLVYSPKNSYSAYLGYANYGADIKLEGVKVGERFTNNTNTEKLDGYTLLNLVGGYQITPHIRIDARVNNLTDEDYTLSSQFGTTYNTDGRNYFGSITYQY